MTPTEAMDRPASDFWMDARIRAAGVKWENDRHEQAMNQSSTGAASPHQQEELVRDQERRADRKDKQDGQPDLSDQMDALQDADPRDGSGRVGRGG